MKAQIRYLILFVALLCVSTAARAAMAGSYTVPSTLYPTLKVMIDSLNNQGLSGAVIVNFTAATNETAPVGGYRLGSAILNPTLSASNTLTINGNGNNITAFVGTSTVADGIFWLAGADFVRINNLNLLESAANTTTTTRMEYGYALGKLSSVAPYDGCQNDIISGCVITLNYLNASSYGILMAHYLPGTNTTLSTASVTPASTNSYNQFKGNTISNVNFGFRSVGITTSAATYDKANIIGGSSPSDGNTITVGGGTTAAYCVYPQYDSVITISNNNFAIATGHNTTVYEVYMGNGYGNLTVTNNNFNLTCSMTTSTCYGFYNYGTSSGHGDPGTGLSSASTHNISSNNFTGNNLVATSASTYNLYEYYAYCYNLNIQNNTIKNEDLGVSTGSIYGIYAYYNYSPACNITDNYVYNLSKLGTSGYIYLCYAYQYPTPTGYFKYERNTYRKIASRYYVYHYIMGSATAPPTGYPGTILYSRYNTIDSVDQQATGTTYFYNYFGYYGQDGSEIAYNTFTNFRGSTAGQSYCYNYTYGYYGPNSYYVHNNTIKNYTANLLGNYNYLGYYATKVDSNVVTDITTTGAGSSYIYNYLAYYLQGAATCSNNRVNNITMGGGYTYNYIGYYGSNLNIHHNAITNYNLLGSTYLYNYIGYYASGANIYNNRVDSIYEATSATFYPWYTYANGSTYNIYNNSISNITTGNTSIALYPYYLYSLGPDINFYNNFLSGINLPATYSGTASCGVLCQSATNFNLYNNTIYIKPGITGGTGYGMTGVWYNTSGNFDFRNNIVNVDVIPNGGFTTALRRTGGTAGISPVNFVGTSNGNILYAPNVTSSWLYGEGGSAAGMVNTYSLTNDPNFNTPCGLFKAFMGHDFGSFTENNLVPATLPATYWPVGASFAEKGGVVTTAPAVVTDFAGVTRGPIVDCGALEFSGTATVDKAPPVISYTPVPVKSYCSSAPTLVATITDNSGVSQAAATAPRLYYKRYTENNTFGANNAATNGWKWVNATTISGSLYTFNFNYSLLPAPAIGPGDSIVYFVIAQDSAATPNTGASIASFSACPGSVVLSSTNGVSLNSSPVANGYKILNTPVFTAVAFPSAVCLSGAATITINPLPLGANIQWQTATLTGAFANIPGATGYSINTGTLTTSQRYRIIVYCGTSVLTTSAIDTFIVANPYLVSTTPGSICGYGALTLGVVPAPFTTANWYTTPTGGSPIATGNTFVTPPTSTSTTYYVSAVTPNASTETLSKSPPVSYSNTIGPYGMQFRFTNPTTNFYSSTVFPSGSGSFYVELVDSAGIQATRYAGPFTVTGSGGVASPNVINYGSSFMNLPAGSYYLQISPAYPYTSSLYLNYEYGIVFPIFSPSGKSAIVSGCYNSSASSYPTYNFFFYNNVLSGDCEASSRTAILATHTPAPPVSVSATRLPGICLGLSDTLLASTLNPYYVHNWKARPSNTVLSTSAFYPITPSATTVYVDSVYDPYTGCVNFDSVVINVNAQTAPPTIAPRPVTICSGTAANLVATAPPGLSGLAQVGNCTTSNTNTGYPTPFGAFYTGSHTQYLYRASDLIAAGITPGNLTTMAINQTAGYTGSAMQNFQIQIAQTSVTTIAGWVTTPTAPGWITVVGPTTYTPPTTAGWITWPIPGSGLAWDGVSSVIIDVQHMNCSTCPTTSCVNYTYNGTVAYCATSYTSVAYVYGDGNCATSGFTLSPSTSTNQMNVMFNYQKPSSINWLNVTSLYKNSTLTNSVSLIDTNKSVYAAPSTMTIYRAAANVMGCISQASLPDTVFVVPSPVVTLSPAGSNTICAGSSVAISVPSGANQTYQWYSAVPPSSPIAGATSNTYNATAAGTYYCVATNLTTGCTATSLGSPVVVNAVPTVTVVSKNATTFCNGGKDSLVATSPTGTLYQWYNGASLVGTGATYVATATGTYTCVVTNALSCTATSTATTITNNVTPTTVAPQGSLSFCTGGSVLFQGPTTPTTLTYQWSNASGAISGATSSSYSATAAGSYWLTVTNSATGCADTSAHFTVVVGAAPASGISPAPTAAFCAGGSVTLAATNTASGLSYQWNNASGPITGATSATYVANAAGSYTLKVSITATPTCNGTTATPTVVSVNPLPTATATAAGPTTFCQGNTVTLNANTGTGLAYQWNANGTPISGANSASYTAALASSYTVTVTNTLTGCIATSNAVAVTVNPAPPATISASGPITFCQGGNVILTSNASNPPYTLVWRNGGVPITGVTSTSYTVNSSGLYTVTATNTTTGCSATSPVTSVQVNALPDATTIPTGSTPICQNTTISLGAVLIDTNVTYQWTLNGVNINGATNSSFVTGTAGTYNLVVSNKVTGCTNTSANIVVSITTPPPAIATLVGTTVICQGDSSMITANTGTGLTYQWKYNGNAIVNATNSVYYATLPGSYTVAVSSGSQCYSTSNSIAITVNPRAPSYITYNSPLNFCQGSAVVLTANTGAGYSYNWLLNGNPTGNTSNYLSAATTGNYTLLVTNSFGCVSTSSNVNVLVYPTPTPVLSLTGFTLQTTTAYSSYQWFFNNTAIGGATNGSYIATANGAYKVRVIDANGCEGYSTQYFINNVGISNTALGNAIKVYPNPTTGILNIDSKVVVKVALRDVTGKTLLEASNVKQIDLGDVANGMYLLYISDMEGHLLRAEKVTKTNN